MIQRITNTKIPEILYKYRSINNDFHLQIITRQEIYFAKPTDLNDPFDANIPIRWDKMSYKECVEKNIELLKTIHSNKSKRFIKKLAKKLTDEKKLWYPDKLKIENQKQLNKWNTIIGLFSLSSEPDNILMWTYYSDNHNGFVVGFDTNSLINDYNFDFIEPISYKSEYPFIPGTEDELTKFYMKFFTKYNDWTHEKEWRISKNHISNRIIKIPKHTITDIIIGCRVNKEQTSFLINKIKNHLGDGVAIYKAIMDNNNYKLNIEQIN